MKHFFTILIFCTWFSSQTAMACCGGNYVYIFPRSSSISSNSCFLIDFSVRELNLKNKIADLVFTAVTSNGKRFDLKVLETNFSGSMGQVFLKVNSNLKIGDKISIQVASNKCEPLSDTIMKFVNSIGYRSWTIDFEVDEEAPIWTKDSIEYSTRDLSNSSVKGYDVILKPQVYDNSKTTEKNEIDKKASLPEYYSVVFNNQKFICASENNYIGIYYSICGSNFNFGIDKTYSAILTAIDASGNYSIHTKTVFFTTIGDKHNVSIINVLKKTIE